MTNNNTTLIADMLRQSMAAGQMPFLTIRSESMAPLLKTGDQVGLEPVSISQLQAGDIITLVQDGDLLTHRFWSLDGQGRLHTRGDRPLMPDAPSTADRLLGRVVVRRRHHQELSLSAGAGARLNQHLAWLAQVESDLLASYVHSQQPRRMVRLVRRAFFTWASLAVKILARLAAQTNKQELS